MKRSTRRRRAKATRRMKGRGSTPSKPADTVKRPPPPEREKAQTNFPKLTGPPKNEKPFYNPKP